MGVGKVTTVGIIGFGGMAGYHFECMNAHPRFRFKGVYDVNPERMAVAKGLGLTAYASKEALLTDPDIDLVLIATTNEVHQELSIEAMEAGKHVLCEKPVTLTAEALRAIELVARKTGKVFSINQNRRTNKDFVLMKESVAKGLIGDVYAIESRVEGSRGMPTGWRTLKALGGGMVYDWGVHLIDQMLYMLENADGSPQKVTHVYCQMLNIEYPEVDDNFKLIMTFESGITAQIEVCTNNYITRPRWYVLGKQGTLQIDDWNCDGKIVRCIDKESTWQNEIVYTKAGPTKTMAPRRPESTETLILSEPLEVLDHLSVVYENVADAIEGTAPLAITIEQALRVLQVMETAFVSNDNKTVVTCHI